MSKNGNGMPESVRRPMMWVMGVAITAFILLIFVIIFGNLSNNVGFTQTSSTFSNETITLSDTAATPATASGRSNGLLSGLTVTNATGGETVPANNYTISGVTITTAGSLYNGSSVNVSGTVTYDSQGQVDSNNVILNYTTSATNTSAQFPTVGTIIGVALLLGILIGLLVFAIARIMKAANATGGSGKGFGSSKFRGDTSSSYA